MSPQQLRTLVALWWVALAMLNLGLMLIGFSKDTWWCLCFQIPLIIFCVYMAFRTSGQPDE